MEAVRCCAFRGVVPILYLFSPSYSRTCPDFLIPPSFTSSRAPCRSLSSNALSFPASEATSEFSTML